MIILISIIISIISLYFISITLSTIISTISISYSLILSTNQQINMAPLSPIIQYPSVSDLLRRHSILSTLL